MFNFNGALLAGQHDSQKERQPPSRPVPVTFPSLTPPQPSLEALPQGWSESSLATHFLNLKKPSDVSLDILRLLNVSFEAQCDFETLLSSLSNNARSFLPPKSWLDAPDLSDPESGSAAEPSVSLLSNGRRAPDRKEFYARAKEIMFNNEDAFSNLSRKPNAGPVPLRLAHFRRFWEGLDNMAYYWDNSLDEYIPPKTENLKSSNTASVESILPTAAADGNTDEAEPTGEPGSTPMEPRKKAKTVAEDDQSTTLSINSLTEVPSAAPPRPKSISSSTAMPARTAPPKVPWAHNMEPTSQKPLDLSQGSYRGNRIGNGAEMPDQYRLESVRAFLEPIAWAFGVSLVPHRRPPVLCLDNIRFPVRMNTVGWRGPADRLRARQGWMEGPLLGVQCRPDTNFGSTGNLEAESVLDTVRELGGMLLLAQERAREGRTERKAGEGRWWTTQSRWGGGPGGEVGEATGASDAQSQDGAPKAPEDMPVPQRSRLGSKDRRRPSPTEVWKTLRPSNPLWDPKVVYEAIGRNKDQDWDDIFLVSSLNHHISVLKLHIHPLYMQYLTDGTLPEKTPTDSRWSSPSLQRTRWYDLFVLEDRTEAMLGLWGIMGYLMRAQEKEQDIVMTDC
ncbi:hypothetical protein P154DRAFT_516603 [Amniculicola lignicola CBS 123094]|uniref:Uncharacterized protein n=1 Tax=Amniculicola lignicola CBS 123094 TaxID=1392246 RepID=A0A6A5X4E3_9PLEO|nr:hypothetical protein P154DRAFT_516603 [Amniculicola lignicola CBS 123094]